MAKNKDKQNKSEGPERRYITEPVKVAKRGDGDNEMNIIEGYAFKFNKVTTIGGWFREEILPGAADDVMNDDIRCLFNHNPSLILARSVNGIGTLTLSVDNVGFKYSFKTPDRSYARDLENAISSGDVDGSSFSFRAKEVIWISGGDNELDLRQIKKFEVIEDVSPVTYPAYDDTTVAKRSHDTFVAENEITDNESDDQKRTSLSVFEAQNINNKNNL